MVTMKTIEKMKKPVVEFPFGNPDELLKRISEKVTEWIDSKKTAESAMIGIHTILAQNRRI